MAAGTTQATSQGNDGVNMSYPAPQPKAYYKLADIMGRPRSDMAIFRKFGSLNMLNLLSLQAELVELQDQLSAIREDDDAMSTIIPVGDENSTISEPESLRPRNFSSSFYDLRRSERTSNNRQWRKLQEIRAVLKEYNEALLQVSKLAQLESPSSAELGFIRNWLRSSQDGNLFLTGTEAFTWRNPGRERGDNSPWHDLEPSEFVTLRPPDEEKDAFSHLLLTRILDFYHKLWGEKHARSTDSGGNVEYDRRKLNRLATWVVTIVSSVMPIIAVLVLYFVRNTLRRIYIMIGLTTAFAIAVTYFTSAKRSEIFAATAAFAAVEVVFIGSVESST